MCTGWREPKLRFRWNHGPLPRHTESVGLPTEHAGNAFVGSGSPSVRRVGYGGGVVPPLAETTGTAPNGYSDFSNADSQIWRIDQAHWATNTRSEVSASGILYKPQSQRRVPLQCGGYIAGPFEFLDDSDIAANGGHARRERLVALHTPYDLDADSAVVVATGTNALGRVLAEAI